MNESWATENRRFHNSTIPKLKRIGKDIGEKAETGNEVCQNIMKYYQMLYDSFDPMTHHFLEEEIKKYEASLARSS